MLAQRDTDRGGRVSQKKKELELEESSVTVEEQDGMQPAVFSLSPDTLPNTFLPTLYQICVDWRGAITVQCFPPFSIFLFVVLQVAGGT